jgi:HNH endonuclease
MNCIFCKQASENSKSVEHIIPESLGNIDHILGKGIVCDKCNNYFASKIEQPLLELPYFVSSRHRNDIENKKGRIPISKGVILGQKPGIVNFHRDKDGKSISFEDDRLINFIRGKKTFSIVIPINELPPDKDIHISKFLGKVGLEALAKNSEGVEGGLKELVDKVELDTIRNYVRYGQGKYWEYHCRPLYAEGKLFMDDKMNEAYEVLHEYKILYTDDFQLLIVLVIFGVEYCLDLGQPTTDTYLKWLKDNNNVSPLYHDSSSP